MQKQNKQEKQDQPEENTIIESSVSYASTVKLIPFWKTTEFKIQIQKLDQQ